MATHTSDLQVQRRRVKHIQQLIAEIGDHERTAAHLMTSAFRATYYFFTAACLIAAPIAYARGKHENAAIWAGIGGTLVLIWLAFKGSKRVLIRAFNVLREELDKVTPDEADKADQAADATTPSAEPAVKAASPIAAPPGPGDDQGRPLT